MSSMLVKWTARLQFHHFLKAVDCVAAEVQVLYVSHARLTEFHQQSFSLLPSRYRLTVPKDDGSPASASILRMQLLTSDSVGASFNELNVGLTV